MEHAISICINLSNNFLILFNVQPQEIQDAESLLEWLNEATKNQYHYNRRIKKNDILKYGPPSLRKSERLNKAIDVLIHNGSIYYSLDRRTTYVVLCFQMGIDRPLSI